MKKTGSDRRENPGPGPAHEKKKPRVRMSRKTGSDRQGKPDPDPIVKEKTGNCYDRQENRSGPLSNSGSDHSTLIRIRNPGLSCLFIYETIINLA